MPRDRLFGAVPVAREAREHPLILGLPRGGIPVAGEIGSALDADLNVLFVRKLRAIGYEELGIGAVVDGAEPQIVLNEDIVGQLSIGNDYIRSEAAHQLSEIERAADLSGQKETDRS